MIVVYVIGGIYALGFAVMIYGIATAPLMPDDFDP